MDLALLDSVLAELGQPSFRAGQVWEWTARGAGSYEEMTSLPVALRAQLEERVPLSSLTVQREALASDGTEKALFHTGDGRPLEAVLMRYRGAKHSASVPNPSRGAKHSASVPNPSRGGRRSVCLSSQSGCPLTCTFCATGTMKFGRNLTASEILDQALHFRRKEEVDHCVFMGMGEPLLNLDNVLGACERLPGLGIHPSSTTISTVGWIPGIERLTERDGPTIRLALSLHAPDDALRSELMPVNDRYPLTDVLDACRRWHEHRRRRVYVEYLMLAGVNDSPEQALALARVLTPHEAFKVNLIPYNEPPVLARPAPGVRSSGGDSGLTGSSREAIDAFLGALHDNGVPATVRLTRGRDIDAACGQLAASTAAA
ncbi:MAG: 23S rRNA (adenine(2503)-C(2))-methyltransferase RlmN [Thermoleophilaceae bacterium]